MIDGTIDFKSNDEQYLHKTATWNWVSFNI